MFLIIRIIPWGWMGSGTGQRRRNYDACSRIPVGKFDDHLGRGKNENASVTLIVRDNT